MTTLLMTFVIFLVAVLLLVSIAMITGRGPKGACGGVAGEACACSATGSAGANSESDPEPELIQIDVGVTVGRK